MIDANTASPDEFFKRADNAGVLDLAPHSDWSQTSGLDHFVQFYETDAFLLNSVSGFLGTGLSYGDAAIMVGTQAHRDGLSTLLGQHGLELDGLRESGQLIILDAAETLSQFMVNGSPDPVLFREVVGGLVERAAAGRKQVRIFGEMVALLWTEGNSQAAIDLENLWNELQTTHPFILFCGYSLNGLGGESHAQPLMDVCGTHSRVIPGESYTSLKTADDRLRAIIQLQQKSRSLEGEIAERKAAEERLRVSLAQEQLARREAEHANRMKDEFLATVSHELRTPLTAIMGWSHMMRKGKLDEATMARAVETIERNAKSQAQLVEDILDVSRMIMGKLRLSIAPVDLAAVINAAIDSIQLAADSREIKLEVTLDPSARHALGDASRLQQVVWNLLSNAIKFTPSGGHVTVRLERIENQIKLCVSDTGCGIQADFLPFVFDRFRQADGTPTRTHGGLGLGLAIVRHLVELHGGTVLAESAGIDQGATFIITLPLASAVEKPARRKSQKTPLRLVEESEVYADSLPQLDGVKILVVDDDHDTLQVISVMLEERKAEVQLAPSVDEALELLQWYQPDVVVSDLGMPVQDGYVLIEKLRAIDARENKRTPAIALTSYVRVADRTRALAAGFNLFVPKPVEPAELITAVAHLAETGSPGI
jgi:signal transduction histidine kinase/ActR/RegA family two-component response regulator